VIISDVTASAIKIENQNFNNRKIRKKSKFETSYKFSSGKSWQNLLFVGRHPADLRTARLLRLTGSWQWRRDQQFQGAYGIYNFCALAVLLYEEIDLQATQLDASPRCKSTRTEEEQ
jgi:hypothetical protein